MKVLYEKMFDNQTKLLKSGKWLFLVIKFEYYNKNQNIEHWQLAFYIYF